MLAAPAGGAAVIGGTNVLLRSATPDFIDADYSLTVFEDEAGDDPTSIFFDVVGTTLRVVATNIDAGSDWYLAQAGDLFTAENIVAGEFVPFFVAGGFGSNDLDVGSSPFYLGVNADDYTPGHAPSGRRAFGWARLQIAAGRLTMLDNAVSYGEGIVVGTTTPVPEPASAALAVAATSVLLARRRRRA